MGTQLMPVQATEVSLVPLHVDIGIRVFADGTRYKVRIKRPGPKELGPETIDMSRDDLAGLNETLREDIMKAVIGKSRGTMDVNEMLYSLGKAGYRAFNKVFSSQNRVRSIVEKLPDYRPGSIIEFASDDFFLPWELIYPDGVNKPVSCKRFLGMRHIVFHCITQDSDVSTFLDDDDDCIPANPRLDLGLLPHNGLPAVKEKEIPFFEQLKKDGRIDLSIYPGKKKKKKKKKKEAKFSEFKRFWEKSFRVAHFACRAIYRPDRPSKSSIILSDNCRISIDEVELSGLTSDHHPLIIMNACETGVINPLYTSSFAALFLKCGAKGVVATEYKVPDGFAADFAEQLYNRLLAGKPVGESLLDTRKHFWKKDNNPFGLLYSLYGPPSIRLTQLTQFR